MLFGKLPAHGDFVARGLDPAERDMLDAWLSASMLDARAAYGDAFEDLYERAPPWRYAVAEGDGWRAGALALSVDAAGRLFPVLAGYVGLDGAETMGAAAAAEALLYRALTEGLDVDAAMAALAEVALEAGDPVEGWWTAQAPSARLDGARPAQIASLMLAAVPA